MTAMKRFFIFSALVLGVISCQKPEPAIDYSGEATLYRVGDSFVRPFDRSLSSLGNRYIDCYFYEGGADPEAFKLTIYLQEGGTLVKGEAIVPAKIAFGNLAGYGSAQLGYTRSVEKGTARYMGVQNGSDVVQFEDLTFKVTRNDGSNITDTYYIRGTSRFAPPPQF